MKMLFTKTFTVLYPSTRYIMEIYASICFLQLELTSFCYFLGWFSHFGYVYIILKQLLFMLEVTWF
jgi:hypothetical protein